MYIANGKRFNSYNGLEDWCIDNGLRIKHIEQFNGGLNLVQVDELDEHEAAINRQRRADALARDRKETIANRNYNW